MNLRTDPRIAISDDEGTWTYADLHARARRIAAALLSASGPDGERKDSRAGLAGERVAIFVSPGGHFVASFFGVLMAGGVVTVLSPLHPSREMLYFCEDAEVRTILVSPDLRPRLEQAAEGRRVLSTDEAVFSEGPMLDEGPSQAPDAPALQLYTSGTTGKPKGAVLTHGNLETQQRLLAEAWEFTERDTLLHALPLHHMHGLAIALLTALGAGATVRMLPGFDAKRIWSELPRATVLMAVPTMYTRLFNAFDEAAPDLRAEWQRGARGLRLATSGSAALPATLAERWQIIAGAIPVERFGMTEIGVGTTNPVHGARKPAHVGLPLPTVRTRIVDDQGQDAEVGELWIAGPSVFSGYYKRPDATRDAFVPDATGERWFRTGDTVTRDADGYFKILGRTSVDILKSGGYKLSALEIEEALREHPAIREVAVVGVPDENWGDRVVACVVAHEGRAGECATELVRTFAKQSLAPYKVPKQVVLMTELPRNAMGKVQKPELTKQLLAEETKGSAERKGE
ncbi:acyl-CoA synthetase [Pendulispora rubella]|uniref:Acyl-CoA synthetase n=1 Tax=Pendulispora rubella TaxID=2741070 RepID=A0ABZ2LCU6_9BACT